MNRSQFNSTFASLGALPAEAVSGTNSSRPSRSIRTSVGEGRKHGHLPLKGVNRNMIDVKVS